MIAWIATGFLLLRLWTRYVGISQALRGCIWVVARKAFPRWEALAKALMPSPRILELQIPGQSFPIYARWPASDLHIVYMIVLREEYAAMADSLKDASDVLFLDLGANIGTASRYMLEKLPQARVVAVEPGSNNVRMCRMNLDPYGSRARVIQAAAWSRNTRLFFERESTQVGTEAGIRVREPYPDEDLSDSVEAIDLATLIAGAGASPSTVIGLKIDIEGSEQEIFSGTNLDWLEDVSFIAIELHDALKANCSKNFFSAVEGRMLESPKSIGETVFVHLAGPNRRQVSGKPA